MQFTHSQQKQYNMYSSNVVDLEVVFHGRITFCRFRQTEKMVSVIRKIPD